MCHFDLQLPSLGWLSTHQKPGHKTMTQSLGKSAIGHSNWNSKVLMRWVAYMLTLIWFPLHTNDWCLLFDFDTKPLSLTYVEVCLFGQCHCSYGCLLHLQHGNHSIQLLYLLCLDMVSIWCCLTVCRHGGYEVSDGWMLQASTAVMFWISCRVPTEIKALQQMELRCTCTVALPFQELYK